jgi:hypothetical protein
MMDTKASIGQDVRVTDVPGLDFADPLRSLDKAPHIKPAEPLDGDRAQGVAAP